MDSEIANIIRLKLKLCLTIAFTLLSLGAKTQEKPDTASVSNLTTSHEKCDTVYVAVIDEGYFIKNNKKISEHIPEKFQKDQRFNNRSLYIANKAHAEEVIGVILDTYNSKDTYLEIIPLAAEPYENLSPRLSRALVVNYLNKKYNYGNIPRNIMKKYLGFDIKNEIIYKSEAVYERTTFNGNKAYRQIASALNFSNNIDAAIENNAKVINCSFVLEKTTDPEIVDIFKRTLEKAFNCGISVVAAAGNNKEELNKYSSYSDIGDFDNRVIVVSAVDNDGHFAKDFSNYGASINIAARGVNVKTDLTNLYLTDPSNPLINELFGHPSYTATYNSILWHVYNNGTSLAAANITAALARIYADIPNISRENAEKILFQLTKYPPDIQRKIESYQKKTGTHDIPKDISAQYGAGVLTFQNYSKIIAEYKSKF